MAGSLCASLTARIAIKIANGLRPILASLPAQAAIEDTEEFRKVLTSIEVFLPEVLQEVHAEWQGENLDGIFPALARKASDDEMKIVGLCCFFDQTLTSLRLCLQLASDEDAVSWLECWLAEATDDGMLRVPYSRNIIYGHKMLAAERFNSIRWVYHVGYGERRS